MATKTTGACCVCVSVCVCVFGQGHINGYKGEWNTVGVCVCVFVLAATHTRARVCTCLQARMCALTHTSTHARTHAHTRTHRCPSSQSGPAVRIARKTRIAAAPALSTARCVCVFQVCVCVSGVLLFMYKRDVLYLFSHYHTGPLGLGGFQLAARA